MHQATITSLSQISGENTTQVEHDDLLMFYAQIVGAVQGITSAGSTIVSVVTSKGE